MGQFGLERWLDVNREKFCVSSKVLATAIIWRIKP